MTSVDVAWVASAIVVCVRAGDFVLVDPHVVLQVGVLDHHALVEDGHDDRLVARREFPRLLALHVGVHDGFPAEHVAAVHEVPLLREQHVVERIGRGFARPGRALLLEGFQRLAGEGRRLFAGVVGAVDGAVDELCDVITNSNYKMICINDFNIVDFDRTREKVNRALDIILPKPSRWEVE